MLDVLTLCPGVAGAVTDPLTFSTKNPMSWENSWSLENWDSWSPYQASEWEYNLELRSWEEVTQASL